MSDSGEQPAPAKPPETGAAEGLEAPSNNHVAETTSDDPTAALRRSLDETRLPAHLKEQILADLPSPEERERLYRELQEKGGLSLAQLLEPARVADEPQP